MLHHAVLITPCTHHVDDGFLTLFAAVAHPFAINAYHLSFAYFGYGLHPAYKTALQFSRRNERKYPIERIPAKRGRLCDGMPQGSSSMVFSQSSFSCP